MRLDYWLPNNDYLSIVTIKYNQMPPKKKKGKKGKKKKEEYLPPVYNIPAYENPDVVTPKVDLVIKLANPVNDLFTLRIRVPISLRIERVH